MAVLSRTLLVITTYNQSKYTRLCFESLKTIEKDVDVLVVDDCSTDNTVELCKEYGHEVITKPEGMGLTDSWNRGYYEFKQRWIYDESGQDDNYDYLIILSKNYVFSSISSLYLSHAVINIDNNSDLVKPLLIPNILY